MNTSALVFYAISAFLLTAGILAVTSQKIFRSAICLLATLVGIAALYFWMQVEFIAAVQIVVYVGGIVVLIIFSIFLTQEAGATLPKAAWRKKVFALLSAVFGFAFGANLINGYGFTPAGKPFAVSVSEMGTQMLSTTEHGYLLPFEVVSILLLAAMIGCIVIALKSPEPAAPSAPVAEPETKTEAPAPAVIAVSEHSKTRITEEVEP